VRESRGAGVAAAAAAHQSGIEQVLEAQRRKTLHAQVSALKMSNFFDLDPLLDRARQQHLPRNKS
jgi:phosphoketolase